MSKLTKHRFSDLYSMSSGISSTKEQAGHGAPFLSFSAVFNSYFVPDELVDLMDASDKQQETYSIKEGDIFLTRTSEVVDELAMSSVAIKNYPKATYSGFLKRLRPTQSDITYPKYMAFYLRSSLFRKTMTNNAVMTLRASLNEDIFSYLDLLLPSYAEQVKVGDFLFNISQKIELNKKLLIEMESTAKTLYNYWFMQFDFPNDKGLPYKSSGGKLRYCDLLKMHIPEHWEAKPMSSLVDIKTGKKDANHASDNGLYHFFTCGEETLFCDDFSFEGKAVLLAGNGSFSVKRYEGKFNAYQRTYVLIPDDERLFGLLYFRIADSIQALTSGSRGSIVKFLTKGDVESIYLPLPKDGEMPFLDSLINLISESENIKNQNLELQKLRDDLIPMLMNGQVTVK